MKIFDKRWFHPFGDLFIGERSEKAVLDNTEPHLRPIMAIGFTTLIFMRNPANCEILLILTVRLHKPLITLLLKIPFSSIKETSFSENFIFR